MVVIAEAVCLKGHPLLVLRPFVFRVCAQHGGFLLLQQGQVLLLTGGWRKRNEGDAGVWEMW